MGGKGPTEIPGKPQPSAVHTIYIPLMQRCLRRNNEGHQCKAHIAHTAVSHDQKDFLEVEVNNLRLSCRHECHFSTNSSSSARLDWNLLGSVPVLFRASSIWAGKSQQQQCKTAVTAFYMRHQTHKCLVHWQTSAFFSTHSSHVK